MELTEVNSTEELRQIRQLYEALHRRFGVSDLGYKAINRSLIGVYVHLYIIYIYTNTYDYTYIYIYILGLYELMTRYLNDLMGVYIYIFTL